jgi:dCMP deaminase
MDKWDKRFLELATLVGSWSKDPSTQVGAVVVRKDNTIASVGYNGFPRFVRDDIELYHDRPTKLLRTVHAEMNAILSAREPLHGCKLYVSPLFPCANCAGAIIQAGIAHVVAQMSAPPEAWMASFEQSRQMFAEAGVLVVPYPVE